LLQLTLQYADAKQLEVFNRSFFLFDPEHWLIIYYDHSLATDSRCQFLKLIFASLHLYMMKQ